MTLHANGTLSVKSWDEKPYSEVAGQPKLTRAAVVYTYHGDLEAEGSVEYLMCYSGNNIAYFIGYEQIIGRLGDCSGSFVLQHDGTFEAEGVKVTLTIVPGSATGDLRGLLGSGVGSGKEEVVISLDYEIA